MQIPYEWIMIFSSPIIKKSENPCCRLQTLVYITDYMCSEYWDWLQGLQEALRVQGSQSLPEALVLPVWKDKEGKWDIISLASSCCQNLLYDWQQLTSNKENLTGSPGIPVSPRGPGFPFIGMRRTERVRLQPWCPSKPPVGWGHSYNMHWFYQKIHARYIKPISCDGTL